MEHYAVFHVGLLIFARNGMGLDLLKKLANVARSRGAPGRWANVCLMRPPGHGLTDTPMCWRNGRQSGRREPLKAGLGAPLSPTNPIPSVVRRSRRNYSSAPVSCSAGCLGADCRSSSLTGHPTGPSFVAALSANLRLH